MSAAETRKKRQHLIRSLYHDFVGKFVFDVQKVVPQTDGEDHRIARAALAQAGRDVSKHVVDIVEMSEKTYDSEELLWTMPVLVFVDDGDEPDMSNVTMQDVLDLVGPEWKTLILYHAWLIATTVFVYAHPQYLRALRKACNNDAPPVRRSCEVNVETDRVFDAYVSNLKAASMPAATSQRELNTMFDSILDSDSVLSKMAKEITEELSIDESKLQSINLQDMLDFSKPNSLFGEVLEQVSKKLNSKMKQHDLRQEDLIKDAMSMMSKLQTNVPGVVNGFPSVFQNVFAAASASPMASPAVPIPKRKRRSAARQPIKGCKEEPQ